MAYNFLKCQYQQREVYLQYPSFDVSPIYLISVPSFLVYKMDFMNEVKADACQQQSSESFEKTSVTYHCQREYRAHKELHNHVWGKWGNVEKVVVVILDKEHRPVEKFVFEITQPPLLSTRSDSLLSHVEQLLRAFILKISVCDAVLDDTPPGCTFTVLVHTREAATRNMEKFQVIKDFPWILADEQNVHMHDPRLIPLKTMTSDILKMQLYIEERAHKSS
ncbi:mitotic spindle assembly checkpoint protein MAD2B-like [Moschus berezovskii]|uniref:mitotic spindle assembly checkpoint protein MAD2B-like n=1 Tax=Moschus berezovskii TaxID=68408 RepID=UPI002444CEAA|nr:mitotic spindle assembly checkpoint protein MAD2B-like [Moschus berezovskii]